MEIIKLKSLLANDEGPKLDFKEKIQLDTEGEKKEFVKDVLAIANSKGGRGYIIFGVEDKTKKLIGISKNDITEETIQQIISSRCEPPVSIKFEQLTVDNKLIGVLTIYKSNLRPHQMIQNGVFYIRRGSTTDVARRDEIATMLQESGIVNFELSIIRKAKLNDLCPSLIMKFFDKNGIKANWDNIMLLDSFGIVQKDNDTNLYCPTLGGLLVFGERPDIFIPSAYITVNIFDKIEIVNGNISTMIKKIDNLFKNIFKESELNSLIELVANALVHRDYYDIS
ncbi:helix-turn-helix domain-containing protein [Caldicellulosiruptoraceae bacterium PP1]